MSRAEPSTLKPEIVEGSILQARTLHENAPHHGRFSIQSRTILAEARKSWTVPFPRPEPSTKTPRIMEGSASRAKPSTLRPEIVEGSISQARTLHENAPHHGRFNIQSGTIHAEARNRGRFHSPGPNPPRFRPESRTVRCKQSNLPRGDSISRTVHVSEAHLPC